MSQLLAGRIMMDSDVYHGKPCVRGLRYPVENILEWSSAGMSIDEILVDYQDLEREDIIAVLGFSASLTKIKRIETLAA